MQEHLAEISQQVGSERHAILVMDQASWHTTESLRVPANISIVLLPPKSPELNPAEKVWQNLCQTFLSNRIFEIVSAHPRRRGCQAAAWSMIGWPARTRRMAASGLRPYRRPVSTIERTPA
jgi:transposase